MSAIDIASLVRQIPSQYPFVLVDRVLEHDASTGLVASKNVSGTEDFFGGHFPGEPVMPGVLLLESLAQAAGVWLLRESGNPREVEIQVVGIDAAKFRRPVQPGDQLRLEVRLLQRRRGLARFRGEVRVGESRVAEARLLLQVGRLPPPQVDPTARVDARAVLEPGVRVGPYCIVGPEVTLGRGTLLDAHVVIDGATRVGERNRFYPFSSIGLAPQDLKYRGEASRLEIGDANTFREFVTVNRGTAGGGNVTRIGSHNLFMTEVHVAHDCTVGDHTIFANAATLAGHVEIQDWATIGAFTGVHQFCRVGTHAFVGGYSVVTKDVLPFSKTVGNRPARVYGVNTVGLQRRGFSRESLVALKEAYRILLQARLNTTEALLRLEAEGPPTPEVRTVVEFVRSSPRGVILKRRRRHVGVEET
ncbi:MAG TPA: acyl-ACP--UDP-N-acetylglucosamine O-acyltransferase [Vicinamibacteria bacterium]|jgi:UDP-N-acetylglucosamine acyltransferase